MERFGRVLFNLDPRYWEDECFGELAGRVVRCLNGNLPIHRQWTYINAFSKLIYDIAELFGIQTGDLCKNNVSGRTKNSG